MWKNISNVAFDESTMSRTQVELQYSRFKEGREVVNDGARPDRPSMSTTDENIEVVKKMILNDLRIIIKEVTDDVGISFGSCQAIFTHVLGMKRLATKIGPKLLNFKQKQCRMDIDQEVLMTFNIGFSIFKFSNPDSCSARKLPSETPGAILFAQKKPNLWGCITHSLK